MRVNEIAKHVTVMMGCRIPIFLHGAPGIGKSDIIRQIGKNTKREVIDIRLALLNPVDLRGIPVAKDGVTDWWAPGFLPKDSKSTAILFLDEFSCAPQAVQNAALQLILDRKLGEYVLPDGVDIVAAGNRAIDKAVVYELSAPLRNRFCHLTVETDFDSWKPWALENGIHHLVMGFLAFKPEVLFQFEAKKFKDNFPTPRSWARVSGIINTIMTGFEATGNKKADQKALTKILPQEIIAGLVGDGPAVEFHSFCKTSLEMPDVDDVLLRGAETPMPKEISVQFAFTSSLAAHAAQRIIANKEKNHINHDNLLQWSATVGNREMAVRMVNDYLNTLQLRKHDVEWIRSTPAYMAFSKKHGSALAQLHSSM